MKIIIRPEPDLAPLPAETTDRIELIPVGSFRLKDSRGRKVVTLAVSTVTDLQTARDAGKLTPAMEDWATQLASKDLAEFDHRAASAPQSPTLAPAG
ncbi:hypothetical protein AL036_17155 [Salipiger aestuarii]|uniref:phage protease n=2 Tax=Salipiger aestuarii TaxID=568098 RepID=UPI00123C6049|nr:phage protease [Salipiger aestuarii]KAA8605849.1 hypothetical protein AL036_17155 [Salipiger aestuarii]